MAATKASKRRQIDWELIEKDYRAGLLSLREIAHKCGCTDTAIRKKAKAEGWERDLTAKVAEEVRAKLVRAEVRKCELESRHDPETEREIIESAASVSVDIILSHRKDLARLKEQEEKLLDELNAGPTKLYLATFQGRIIEKVVDLTVSEKSATLLALSNVRKSRIELERKIFNIDGERDKGRSEEESAIAVLEALTRASQKIQLPSSQGAGDE